MFDAARRNFLKSPVWLGLASPFVIRQPLQVENGYLRVPQEAGIGIEVDVDALRRVVARAPKELARV